MRVLTTFERKPAIDEQDNRLSQLATAMQTRDRATVRRLLGWGEALWEGIEKTRGHTKLRPGTERVR